LKKARNNVRKLPNEKDEIMVQLLKWYKNWMKWVNKPPCQFCQGETQSLGMTAATPEELNSWASRVELYQCNTCSSYTRFPRYNHPRKLLQTRKGRCGEYANLFTLLCRAMGYEARYILDLTDHVWTEVYCEEKQQFVHTDCCEAKYDCPNLYEKGWGKKLSYIFAFSADEVIDVTQRYTKKWNEVLTRRIMVTEEWLNEFIIGMNEKLYQKLPSSRRDFF